MTKQTSGKADRGTAPPPSAKKGGSEGKADFPKHTLEEALAVAQVLEEKNGGNPLPPTEIANALGKSPGSSEFRILLSSSIKYGFTTGSYNQRRISLEEPGRDIVEPKSHEAKSRALVQAALRCELFRKIYEAYKGKRIPETQFFRNTLVRDFSVAQAHADRCAQIFFANAEYLGLVKQAKTGKWLSAEADTTAAPVVGAPTDAASALEEPAAAVGEVGAEASAEMAAQAPPPGAAQDRRARRVFLTHGKNKAFIEPIKKLLTFGEFEAVVAAERESVSQPVPDKVMNDMRSCGAAIIHVEDELRLVDKDASEHVVLNPNVLIEIGAAMGLYGRRFILLVKEGIKLPSNLQGLYEVRYEGNALSGDVTIKLLEAINDIKNHPLPMAVADGARTVL
jgi:predicted nucleotide-binding protein